METQNNKKLRVALVAHDIHFEGGMEQVFGHLIRRLQDKVQFKVLSTTLAPELRPLVDWHRIKVPRAPFSVKFLSFYIVAALKLARLDVDLRHSLGAVVPNRVEIAAVQFCHLGFVRATRRLTAMTGVARRINSAIARLISLIAEAHSYKPSRLNAFAAASAGVATEVQALYRGIPVHVISNGIDTKVFSPSASARKSLRRKEGIADEIVVLFVGGDWAHKGLEPLIKGLGLFAKSSTPFRLWVVGRGDESRYSEICREEGVLPNVKFFGHRSDRHRFFQAADIFALPSVYETFSLASFEAAACGVPLVIPRLHGASELVGMNEAGIIIERNPASVAKALEQLAGDPQLRAELGMEARRRASKYGWDEPAEATLRLYETVLSASPNRRMERSISR